MLVVVNQMGEKVPLLAAVGAAFTAFGGRASAAARPGVSPPNPEGMGHFRSAGREDGQNYP